MQVDESTSMSDDGVLLLSLLLVPCAAVAALPPLAAAGAPPLAAAGARLELGELAERPRASGATPRRSHGDVAAHTPHEASCTPMATPHPTGGGGPAGCAHHFGQFC